jgi:hypothetical protein
MCRRVLSRRKGSPHFVRILPAISHIEIISRSLGNDLGVLFAARRVGNRLDVRAALRPRMIGLRIACR